MKFSILLIASIFLTQSCHLAFGGGKDYACEQEEYLAFENGDLNDTMTVFYNATWNQKNRRLAGGGPVRFYAMGDAPYNAREFANIPVQLAKLDKTADFLIHLGDMQDRRGQCRRYLYAQFSQLLKKAQIPTFIIPGDNDYHDCNNWRNGWSFWKETFIHFDQNWNTPFNVRYQAARQENFAFRHQGVLFVGIHTLHGRIKNQKEWNRLQNDNLQWCRNQLTNFAHGIGAVVIFSHAYTNKKQYPKFWEGLSKLGEDSGLPILYLQGDAHKWLQSTPFRAKNILRTVVDRGGIADPVLVTVDPFSNQPFRFQRRPLTKG